MIDTAVCKDTVTVLASGYVVVAFVADNPGYWFLHCHIEVHQLEGMAVIIQEYDETEHNYNLPGKFGWTVADFIQLTSAGVCMQSPSATLLSIILFITNVAGY